MKTALVNVKAVTCYALLMSSINQHEDDVVDYET
jgi:hypothetical protein